MSDNSGESSNISNNDQQVVIGSIVQEQWQAHKVMMLTSMVTRSVGSTDGDEKYRREGGSAEKG